MLDKLQYSAVAVTCIVDHNTDFIVKFPDWDPSNTSSALPQAHLWYSTKKVINALRLFIDAGNNFAGSLTYRFHCLVKSKLDGGLGVKLVPCLLGKWLWRFGEDIWDLWGCLWGFRFGSRHGCGLWIAGVGETHLRYKVGIGDRVLYGVVDSATQMLLHCPVAAALWSWYFTLLGQWVMSGSVVSLLSTGGMG
uniref:Alpha-N-acetylglucosaminidase C-terminal domain-containing protein n=1 Tax=Fagus sylvatica TaxID=28930 RepID=A0A2N9GT43_FAGSY